MDKNNWKCIVQIESTTHFHPQVASKAEKVFPIPLNRKTLLIRSPVCQFLARCILSSLHGLRNGFTNKNKNGLEHHFVKNLSNPSSFK